MKLRSFLLWPALLLLASAPADQSTDPCRDSIRWRVAEVDERFGLTSEEVAQAVREATMLWAEAAGNPLLFQESADGFPVRLIYDGRQERTVERQRRQDEIAVYISMVTESEGEVLDLRQELETRRRDHQAGVEALRQRLDAHRETVERWEGEAIPPTSSVIAQLQEQTDALESERTRLNEEARALNELVDQLNEDTRELNRQISELNEAQSQLQEEFPLIAVHSAYYRETRRTAGPLTLSVERQIEVYQFADWNSLVRIIAHEFGHALGIEHSEEPGAVMGDLYAPRAGGPPTQLHPDDVRKVQELCGDSDG